MACDLFKMYGKDYLLVVDYHSEYFEVAHLGNLADSPTFIHATKKIISHHGIPKTMVRGLLLMLTSSLQKNGSLTTVIHSFHNTYRSMDSLKELRSKLLRKLTVLVKTSTLQYWPWTLHPYEIESPQNLKCSTEIHTLHCHQQFLTNCDMSP